ncbi:MAG: 2-oxoacid:ferredoxin oxidoreductase subunit beta [Deltaproteobacteria bacterium]|nr:2-oxoacid:ferredoxin oxidoreductase subunit beta [Deltaproteobacteria bacterium]MBW1960172.1 2-oxoacid:ferredoxin oxidoreductase subunit beta [Deltaproteobacteria bacterium]MBW2152015.1 2-oxoacid:ferredoxin oxidoreductase subunit beta [Deltaproteobacteria bacterium]
MKKHPMLKYLKEKGPLGDRLPLIMCPGCGCGQVLNVALHAVDRLITEEGIPKEHFVFITGVGCSARLTSHYLNFDSGWTLHGRTLAIATGALLANPKLRIIVITGDGDTGAIGGNHFIHACRRNLDITILCINNGLYGMTGGQVAPTSSVGMSTTTTPYGNTEQSFDLCKLAQTAGATYVARWTTAHPHQSRRAIEKGILKKGTAFIEIMAQCPVHRKRSPAEMLKELKKNTVRVKNGRQLEEGKIPVGEFCNIQKPEWIESYQKIIDRFAGNRPPSVS